MLSMDIISPPTSSTQIQATNIPPQLPIKTIRGNPDFQNSPFSSKKSASKDNRFVASNYQNHFYNTATLPILHFNKIQIEIPL